MQLIAQPHSSCMENLPTSGEFTAGRSPALSWNFLFG
jgi:hypothetical protein